MKKHIVGTFDGPSETKFRVLDTGVLEVLSLGERWIPYIGEFQRDLVFEAVKGCRFCTCDEIEDDDIVNFEYAGILGTFYHSTGDVSVTVPPGRSSFGQFPGLLSSFYKALKEKGLLKG